MEAIVVASVAKREREPRCRGGDQDATDQPPFAPSEHSLTDRVYLQSTE